MSKMNASDFGSLLEEAIAQVLRGYGAEVQSGSTDTGADLLVDVPTAHGMERLTVEVKPAHPTGGPRRGRKSDIAAHHYVPPSMAANYRDRGMFYVDALGNAYIALPGFLLDVQGRKPPKTAELRQLKPNRAFGWAGARLVFALLVAPDATTSTVRELSKLSRVAIGTVVNTLQDLEINGFLTTTSGRRELRRTAQLTELWMSSYLTRISPKLEEVSLTGPDPRWWISAQLPADACLGGGTALAAMGYDVLPATTLIYGQPPWGAIRKAGRLRRDGEPNVTLRQPFWDPKLNPSPTLVPPLLVYADAKASDDPRQVEAAEDLWETNEDLRRLRARD